MRHAVAVPRRAVPALVQVVDLLNSLDVPFQITGVLAGRFYGAKRTLDEIELTISASSIALVARHLETSPECQKDEQWERPVLNIDAAGVPVRLVGSASRCFDQRRRCWVGVRANLVHSTWIEWGGRQLPVEPRGPLMRMLERCGRDQEVREILSISQSGLQS